MSSTAVPSCLGQQLESWSRIAALDGHVEGRRRLVRDEQRGRPARPIAMSARWRMPPENSCGYWPRPALGVGQADLVEQLDGARPARRGALRRPLSSAPRRSGCPIRSDRVEVGHRVLRHEAELCAPRSCAMRCARHVAQVLALEQDLPGGDASRCSASRPEHGRRERGLARAGLAHDRDASGRAGRSGSVRRRARRRSRSGSRRSRSSTRRTTSSTRCVSSAPVRLRTRSVVAVLGHRRVLFRGSSASRSALAQEGEAERRDGDARCRAGSPAAARPRARSARPSACAPTPRSVGAPPPRPRKDSAAASITAVASMRVACTITGPTLLGSTWLIVTERRLRPSERAGQHVVLAALREHRAAQQPGEDRDLDDADGDDHRHRRLAGDRGDRDGQQQRRHRQHEVDEAHRARSRPTRRTQPASSPRAMPPTRPNSVDRTPMSSEARAPQISLLSTSPP